MRADHLLRIVTISTERDAILLLASGVEVELPTFNREKRVTELLRQGRAVLLIKTWDTPGVLAAGKGFIDALELPALTEWDSPASEDGPADGS